MCLCISVSQDALNDASPGDTIYIPEGTHYIDLTTAVSCMIFTVELSRQSDGDRSIADQVYNVSRFAQLYDNLDCMIT